MPDGYKLKRIMMRPNGVEKQVRPDNKWKPGADTVAYYPLTSTSTVNDMSGNNRNLTINSVSPTFGLYQGVDCALFSGSNNQLNGTEIKPSVHGTTITVSFWLYITGGGHQAIMNQWYSERGRTISSNANYDPAGYIYAWGKNGTPEARFNINANSATRTNLCLTIEADASNPNLGYLTTYTNAEKQGETSVGWYGADPTLKIGQTLNGGISDFIIEKKVWTEEERTNYFNQVKAKYGL